ncbi:S1 family peptidase [Verrucomicrobiota bacterium sgz303538]
MFSPSNRVRVSLLFSLLYTAAAAFGEAPAIPTVIEGRGPSPELIEAASKLRDGGGLMSAEQVAAQLDRTSCALTLPRPRDQKLNGRAIWEEARRSHMRVGYFYLCPRCENWHLNLAGGYAITADGAVATCFHVVSSKDDIRKGFLVAVTENDQVLPVTEVLAGSKLNDVCILRVKNESPLAALPLNPDARPGDDAWCYSDPLGHSGYFSKGIVNRYFQPVPGKNSNQVFPRRMNVSTDWAPGSSGAAVLDECGNAIGHVSEISAQGKSSQQSDKGASGQTLIVFHHAVCAADVLALVRQEKAESK